MRYLRIVGKKGKILIICSNMIANIENEKQFTNYFKIGYF